LTGLSDPIACITGTNEKTYFQLILLFLISWRCLQLHKTINIRNGFTPAKSLMHIKKNCVLHSSCFFFIT
jgi:hypothetical protein